MLNLKTKILKTIAGILGVKVHVYKQSSKEKTIDTDSVEGPNDFKQPTSIPERQIGD
jgi:ribosomal protein S3